MRAKKILLIILLILSLFSAVISGGKIWELTKVKMQSDNLSKDMEKHIQDFKLNKAEEIKLSKDIIKLANENYNVNNISAIVNIGDNLINEPVIVDPEANFNRKLPNGEYAYAGSIMIYGPQKSPNDNYCSYYGHSMKDGTRFGKLLNQDSHPIHTLNTGKVFTNEGIINLELVHYSKITDDYFYENDFNSFKGISKFVKETESAYTPQDYHVNPKIGEEDFVVTLTTCAVAGGESRVVAIYKEAK